MYKKQPNKIDMNCGECDADFACGMEGVPCIRLVISLKIEKPQPQIKQQTRVPLTEEAVLDLWDISGTEFPRSGMHRAVSFARSLEEAHNIGGGK